MHGPRVFSRAGRFRGAGYAARMEGRSRLVADPRRRRLRRGRPSLGYLAGPPGYDASARPRGGAGCADRPLVGRDRGCRGTPPDSRRWPQSRHARTPHVGAGLRPRGRAEPAVCRRAPPLVRDPRACRRSALHVVLRGLRCRPDLRDSLRPAMGAGRLVVRRGPVRLLPRTIRIRAHRAGAPQRRAGGRDGTGTPLEGYGTRDPRRDGGLLRKPDRPRDSPAPPPESPIGRTPPSGFGPHGGGGRGGSPLGSPLDPRVPSYGRPPRAPHSFPFGGPSPPQSSFGTAVA